MKNNIGRGHNIKYNPYAFTEQGIYMLMTVLKGKLATKQSKALVRIFKKMKDYLIDNNLIEQKFINNLVLEHDKDIKLLQETFDKLEEKEMKNKLIFNEKIYDTYSKIIDILNESKKEIIIIDNYADKKVLDIISNINKKIILITNKSILKDIDIEKYNRQYNNLEIIYSNIFHDRFIVLDRNKLYHLGSSINHIGNKITVINVIEEDIFKNELFSLLKKLFD